MLDDETICEITREVIALFGYAARPIAELRPASGVSSSIAIDGPESAIVEVQMPWDVASQLAEVMVDVEDTSPEFVRDVAGEIVNMIGSNMQSLILGPSQLSIPSVNARADHWSSFPAPASMQRTIGFECELGRFFVTVTRTSPQT